MRILPSDCQLSELKTPLYCESYNCRGRAAYAIGRSDGPISLRLNLCKECVGQMLNSVPADLWPADLVQGQVEAKVSELREQIRDEVLEELAAANKQNYAKISIDPNASAEEAMEELQKPVPSPQQVQEVAQMVGLKPDKKGNILKRR